MDISIFNVEYLHILDKEIFFFEILLKMVVSLPS